MKICLETRTTPEGFKRRRYLLADGVTRMTTMEVPLQVWNGVNRAGRGSDRALAHARGLARAQRRVQSLAHRDAGWPAVASAHELGVHVVTVYRWWAA